MTAPCGIEFAGEMMFPGRALPARRRPTLQSHPAMRPWTFRAALMGAAARSLERGNTNAAKGQLNAFLNEIDAMVRSGRLSAAQVEALREVLGRTLNNL